MIFSVIASGSKGNVSYVASRTTKLLIDIGLSSKTIEKNLRDLDVDPCMIDGILLTHTHTDHIQGLKTFIKKFHTKIYLSAKMYEELSNNIDLFQYEIVENQFKIEDITVNIIKLSHDTEDSNGYIIEANHKSLVYITDTGYIHRKNHSILSNKDIYVIESNHDVDMLMNSRRPYHIKQRILGDKGHLSNKDSSMYVSDFMGKDTKKIVLIHLSEEANTLSLAKTTLEQTLEEKNLHVEEIIVSTQQERTELISV